VAVVAVAAGMAVADRSRAASGSTRE